MASHILDFLVLGNNFGTSEMRAVWSEQNRLEKQVEVEVALAQAQGELGVIPVDVAKTIVSKANAAQLSLEEIAEQAAKAKHSLMSTINALQQQVGQAGQFIHYGATTQDIVDTATVLQLKQSFSIIERDTKLVALELKRLAKQYQYLPMVGRTHGMQALPTTFGFKLAVWLDEFVRHLQRLNEIKQRVLVGNISGAICTYASIGKLGSQVEERALSRLGLNTPNIGWQAARDRFSEYASVIALISGSLGKIGNEFYNLMRTEINEVEEPFSDGKIGSTTMPHKRNPAALEGLASLTAPLLKSVALIHESMKVEHERDAMSWRAEWIALPEINLYISAQLQTALAVLKGLKVNADRMLANLSLQNGLLLSEKVMFEIGKRLGKQTAHHLVYQCAMRAFEQNQPFKTVLLADPNLNQEFSEAELDSWLDPINYLGLAPEKVDQVIDYAEQSGVLA
ncbi:MULTISPECIES: adenylosuccinate lyase [unclassified Gilliamella]|uniref:adenylosuccinate lyase n=1 Tax=unclassified Gilliamella TaxID=2685620 RepID=UPI00226AB052|nr:MULTISPECIES: adenylosuccinate lyase [unclassified Gilliamella]MCX8601806.1 adenylosuccinate lyase [Gilliamella sp. B3722]MCX8608119.1 adenylosuccinate lyase [Gilliamella sp. B3771]MCX8611122.1 adenylosuccinate lyase [Gilliamella sp. B3891]MCX8613537.1 adenylosuccinate lyase [Gilliamella sp. B3773]MCX8614418.1 adenylosuccinate lyase [Gilliamella sp. B3770]